jgi:hypothetical protein
MAKVIARINKRTGDIEFEVNGIKGSSCKDITTLITQGLDVYKEEEKPEMYEVSDLPDFIENM